MLKLIMNNCIMNKLRSLCLCHNDINTGGDTFIADFIMSNSGLRSLKLLGNKLDDNDATNIADALKHNTYLETLNIGENNLTNEGWRALSKAVFDKTSLNSAAGSNHTCCIDFPEDDTVEFDEVREINGIDSGLTRKAQTLIRFMLGKRRFIQFYQNGIETRQMSITLMRICLSSYYHICCTLFRDTQITTLRKRMHHLKSQPMLSLYL